MILAGLGRQPHCMSKTDCRPILPAPAQSSHAISLDAAHASHTTDPLFHRPSFAAHASNPQPRQPSKRIAIRKVITCQDAFTSSFTILPMGKFLAFDMGIEILIS